jgi:hypothetical protein
LAVTDFNLFVGGADANGDKIAVFPAFVRGSSGIGPAVSTLQGPATKLSNPAPLLAPFSLYVLNDGAFAPYFTEYQQPVAFNQKPLLRFEAPGMMSGFPPNTPFLPKACFAWPQTGAPAGGLLCVPCLHQRILLLQRSDLSPFLIINDGKNSGPLATLRALTSLGPSLYALSQTVDEYDVISGFVIDVYDATSGTLKSNITVTVGGGEFIWGSAADIDVDNNGNIYALVYQSRTIPGNTPSTTWSLNVYPPNASGLNPKPTFTITGPDAGFVNPSRVAVGTLYSE